MFDCIEYCGSFETAFIHGIAAEVAGFPCSCSMLVWRDNGTVIWL